MEKKTCFLVLSLLMLVGFLSFCERAEQALEEILSTPTPDPNQLVMNELVILYNNRNRIVENLPDEYDGPEVMMRKSREAAVKFRGMESKLMDLRDQITDSGVESLRENMEYYVRKRAESLENIPRDYGELGGLAVEELSSQLFTGESAIEQNTARDNQAMEYWKRVGNSPTWGKYGKTFTTEEE